VCSWDQQETLQKLITSANHRSQQSPDTAHDVVTADDASEAAQQKLSEASVRCAAAQKLLGVSKEAATHARKAAESAEEVSTKCEEECSYVEREMNTIGEQLAGCRCAFETWYSAAFMK
jgi:hypothetical protein